ncbi:MAG: RadC family protein [Clostridia bacterium]|nr:RadC family protein [Clostridia bacterium]
MREKTDTEDKKSCALTRSELHGGHRTRLLERLKKDCICDHEYLEIVLFNAIPRRNTNDLAHRLLSEFGDLDGVLSAPVEQLARVEGVGDRIAGYIRVIGVFLKKREMQNRQSYPSRFSMAEFVPFMRREYASLTCEVLDVYILDSVGRIYGRKRSSSSREKKVEVQMRWLMNVLSDFNPSGILLVHNHPIGEAVPSATDDNTTEECRLLCEKSGVLFCDHFIYSSTGIYSYNFGKQIGLAEYGEKE